MARINFTYNLEVCRENIFFIFFQKRQNFPEASKFPPGRNFPLFGYPCFSPNLIIFNRRGGGRHVPSEGGGGPEVANV